MLAPLPRWAITSRHPRPLAQHAQDVLVRQAVEAVLVHPLLEELPGQRQPAGDLRHAGVKGGVETGHLRQSRALRAQRHRSPAGSPACAAEPRPCARAGPRSARGSAASGRDGRAPRGPPGGRSPRWRGDLLSESAASACSMASSCSTSSEVALGERLPCAVDEPEPALALPDALDGALGQQLFDRVPVVRRAHLVQVELQRGRAAVDAQDGLRLAHQSPSAPGHVSTPAAGLQLRPAEAVHGVIVHHAGRLHVRVQMVGPTNRNPRFLRSPLSTSASAVFAGISAMVRHSLWMVSPSTNRQT